MVFEGLSERMQGVFKELRGEGHLTDFHLEQALRQIRLSLLEADVALPVVRDFTARVKERAVGAKVTQQLSPAQEVTRIVRDELMGLLGGVHTDLALQGKPAVILLVGLQGSGKTTSAGKLARHLKTRGRYPLRGRRGPGEAGRRRAARHARPAGRRSRLLAQRRLRSRGARARRRARGEADRTRHRHRGHGGTAAHRRGAHGAGPRGRGRRRAPGDSLRRRRDDRAGRGEVRGRIRRGAAAHRDHPDEDRRRRARRRGALRRDDDGQADQVRRRRREARGLRAVPSRPHGVADPRPRRRAHADREGRADGRRRVGAAAGGEDRRRGSSRSRTCATSSPR